MKSIVISWQPPVGANIEAEAGNVAEFLNNNRTSVQAVLQMEAHRDCEAKEQHPTIGIVGKYGKYRGNRACVEVKFCNECMNVQQTVKTLREIIKTALEEKDLPDLRYELNDIDVDDLVAGRLSSDRVGQA